MGWATQRGPRPRLVATSHRLASCVIVSRFRTALDLDTYPFSNFIRPRCAERAKRGRSKPVLIMHIGFLACFHAISPERSGFSKIVADKQPRTVTLAAHARRLKLVKAVQDFSAGCSTCIEPQNDMLFIK